MFGLTSMCLFLRFEDVDSYDFTKFDMLKRILGLEYLACSFGTGSIEADLNSGYIVPAGNQLKGNSYCFVLKALDLLFGLPYQALACIIHCIAD